MGDVDKSTFSENLGCRRQAVRDRRPRKCGGPDRCWWEEAFSSGPVADLTPPIAIIAERLNRRRCRARAARARSASPEDEFKAEAKGQTMTLDVFAADVRAAKRHHARPPPRARRRRPPPAGCRRRRLPNSPPRKSAAQPPPLKPPATKKCRLMELVQQLERRRTRRHGDPRPLRDLRRRAAVRKNLRDAQGVEADEGIPRRVPQGQLG